MFIAVDIKYRLYVVHPYLVTYTWWNIHISCFSFLSVRLPDIEQERGRGLCSEVELLRASQEVALH